MTLYGFGMTRNASAPSNGPIALEGLDDRTIQHIAEYILSDPDDLDRRLQMSLFAARCGVLSDLQEAVRLMEEERDGDA